MPPTKILFMDLDDTLILGPKHRDGAFIKGPQDVELFPGVLERLKWFKSRGWRLVLISNQGGIALNLIDESVVARIFQEVNRLTANLFDRMQWCPHHPDAKMTIEEETLEAAWCMCRKPLAGMIYGNMLSLAEQHGHEYYRPYTCLMVGDMDSDRECAKAAAVPFLDAVEWRDTSLEAFEGGLPFTVPTVRLRKLMFGV